MKWGNFINIDTIAIFLLVIAVIYCFLTTKKKRTVYDFHGIGESGWNVTEGNFWNYGVAKHKRRRQKNKHEERCREIFQDIYEERFKSVRPDWLKNPATGKNLELDGYCPRIRTPLGTGLAFEYDGAQHSKYNKHFHRSGHDEFLYQTKKDSWKDIRCKQEGVYLIRIPHFVAYEDLERYIINKLEKSKLMPRDYQKRKYERRTMFRPQPRDDYLKNGGSRDPTDIWKSSGNGFLSGLYS
jgi:hypothetical protein